MRRNIIIGVIAVVVVLGGIMLWRNRNASQDKATVQSSPESTNGKESGCRDCSDTPEGQEPSETTAANNSK